MDAGRVETAATARGLSFTAPESVNASRSVAVCAEPVPAKVKLAYGEPSEDGQVAPPPFTSCEDKVRLTSSAVLPQAAPCRMCFGS